MIDKITKHWLAEAEGWRTVDRHSDYPFADLVAVRESGEDDELGEVVLIACANDADCKRGFCIALGRLVLMMDRDFNTNAFGHPQRDSQLSPPLVRYVLAVPAEPAWLPLLRSVPLRIRKMLHLNFLRVSDDELIRYLPNIPV
jgi:hypothetical protein